MNFTREITTEEELLLKGEGFTAEYCINNAIDYIIRVQREKVGPASIQAVVEGRVAAPALMSREEVMKAYLKSPEFKTVNEVVAEREIEEANRDAANLQVEIDAEQDADKKAEKQARKDAAMQRKSENETALSVAQSEKAALVAGL